MSIERVGHGTYGLAPIKVNPSHSYGHFSQVCHLLTLESVKVCLYGGRRVLEILGSEVLGVFQLYAEESLS